MDFFSIFAGSTSNVIKNVLLGKADAGAVFVTDLEMEPKELQAQLQPIVVTQQVAPHPLCAHPRVPRSVRETVKKAVLSLAEAPEGAELLRKVRLAAPVAADYERDYKSLDQIDVKGLSNWGE